MTLVQKICKSSIHLCLMIGLALTTVGCQPSHCKIDPVIIYTPPPHRISNLPSAFDPLSAEERQEEWAKELLIGDVFAEEWDLYRAITSYKRALILLPEDAIERRLQIEYDLIFCYYLGLKYQEAVNIFEESDLIQANPLFPAFNNLLIILYECYKQLGQEDKAACLQEAIQKCSPETAEDLSLFWLLKKKQLEEAQALICEHRDFETIQPQLNLYYQYAKSPKRARMLNAVLPGAGYYYVGQRKSALTSFLINALFTYAAYQFFQRGYPAAGLITASMEMGWYYGGINGAGIEAEEFNNRLYEGVSKQILVDHKFFPVLMFETSF
ncbi:conserved hypothetical protein [Candidatus Protochlamydia naegleriophila]|uniref:Uncharacterized protein n=1 Tax=Candidatus Protochlamydia naegleriophila TaxID=389348 RepID=A0A0U5EPJ2_9BACT|nr:hypothetical protein [Candidatus Protochlamydia naegleriophila]CUI15968.1 conserved hypothetical protein [Candidatus Protochlamydia naegleriophila]